MAQPCGGAAAWLSQWLHGRTAEPGGLAVGVTFRTLVAMGRFGRIFFVPMGRFGTICFRSGKEFIFRSGKELFFVPGSNYFSFREVMGRSHFLVLCWFSTICVQLFSFREPKIIGSGNQK